MFKFLADRFIKSKGPMSKTELRLSYISLSSMVGIGINLLLFFGKLIPGLLISSQAIVNDAFNNLSDSLASIMALFGSSISKKPADKEHPFGHGRTEYIISMLVSIVIMYVGVSLFISSILSFGQKKLIVLDKLTIIILLVSIGFKIYIYFLNRSLSKNLDSELNHGVMLDAKNDILATSSIMVGVYLQRYVYFNIDAILGVVLAIFVFMPGFEMFMDTSKTLIGKRVDPEIEGQIGKIIMAGEYVEGYHDLQIHEYGKGKMAGSCHVEVPANLTVDVVHRSIDKIEKEIYQKTGVSITIHMDPTYCLVEN